MNIVVIEDEKLTSNDLVATITKIEPGANIMGQLFSVKESIFFFEQKPKVDLIFSDIQLGDGICFDIFSQVHVDAPVIFCTAYDEYALDAFHANGIEYILKPFTDKTMQTALGKYQTLKENLCGKPQPMEELLQALTSRKDEEQGALLVYHQDKIIPVAMSDIAFFFLNNGIVQLATLENKTYHLNKTLDEMERTAGTSFFRVNRQYLVNRKAVIDASNHSSRKLSVTLSVPSEEMIVVSKEKMPQFLHWLTLG